MEYQLFTSMSLGVIIVLYIKNSPISILICTEYVNTEHNIPQTVYLLKT